VVLGRRGDPLQDAAAVASLVGAGLDDDVDEGFASGIAMLLTMGGLATFGVSMVNLFVTGPLLALAWRSRGYLADATAVELTRNPDALARALAALAERGGGLPGSAWLELNLVVGPETADDRALARMQVEQAELAASDAGSTGWRGRVSAGIAASNRYRAELASNDAARRGTLSDTGIAVSLQPSLAKRLERLHRLGATDLRPPTVRPPASRALRALGIAVGILVLGPLFAILAVLVVVVVIMVTMLAALAAFIVLGIVAGPIHGLLRGVAAAEPPATRLRSRDLRVRRRRG
jgi:hypothetical protein